jgi:serine/threonine protein kinase
MGLVLRCWDEWRGHHVALKMFHPHLPFSSVEQLRRECGLQAQLQHEAVVSIYDWGRTTQPFGGEAECWFYTMEYVEGESLQARLEARAKEGMGEDGPLFSVEEVGACLGALVSVLGVAHGAGVIHRDVKPSNVMLTEDGIRLLDFGIAVDLEGRTSVLSEQAGTAYYMAPEQLEAGGKLTPATDVYALGVMAYQCLTGKLPAGRVRGPWSWWKQQGQEPAFPKALDAVMLRALEPDTSVRYESVSAFWEAWQDALTEPSSTRGKRARSGPRYRKVGKADKQEQVHHKKQKEPASDTQRRESYVMTIDTPEGVFGLTSLLAEGELSDVYEGVVLSGAREGTRIVAKIVDSIGDNDLMRDEIRTLRLLHAAKGQQCKHLPRVLGEFLMPDGRQGCILEALEGLTLEALMELYPQGLPVVHVMWIMRRVLSVLGYAHSLGVLHGNIEPAHLLVRPADHNVFLLDWSYSIVQPGQTGQGFKCVNETFSGPEVAARKPPLPAADLYSLGKTMVALLGGDTETGEVPDAVDEPLRRFLDYLTRESPIQRPRDAWELYHEVGRMRRAIFGKHHFVPLVIPEQ